MSDAESAVEGSQLDLRAVGDRIESLLTEISRWPNPAATAVAEEVVRTVTELYGGALERVVDIAGSIEGEAGDEMRRRLLKDDLVASLLVVHGLHPLSVEERVADALNRTRPYLSSHGGDVRLVEVDADRGVARLELLGSCQGCPSSTLTLRQAIEVAIAESAPEITGIEDVAADRAGTSSEPAPVTLIAKPQPAGVGVSR